MYSRQEKLQGHQLSNIHVVHSRCKEPERFVTQEIIDLLHRCIPESIVRRCLTTPIDPSYCGNDDVVVSVSPKQPQVDRRHSSLLSLQKLRPCTYHSCESALGLRSLTTHCYRRLRNGGRCIPVGLTRLHRCQCLLSFFRHIHVFL